MLATFLRKRSVKSKNVEIKAICHLEKNGPSLLALNVLTIRANSSTLSNVAKKEAYQKLQINTKYIIIKPNKANICIKDSEFCRMDMKFLNICKYNHAYYYYL